MGRGHGYGGGRGIKLGREELEGVGSCAGVKALGERGCWKEGAVVERRRLEAGIVGERRRRVGGEAETVQFR